MKKYSLFITLISLLFFASVPTSAQEVSTEGRDFWVSFLPNGASSTPKLELLVTGKSACTGKATNPSTGWSTSFTVSPGTVTSVVIPCSEGLTDNMNRIEHKAIHVTTTGDVSLYASNFVNASYDVANVLPTPILMDKYIASSYTTGTTTDPSMRSKLLIVATENDTKITINPMGGLKGVFPPLSKKDITLNAGECYLFISAKGDISGTSVNVKNGKKVAVFSGGETQIPYEGCCYDAVFEQCIPMVHWGKHFVVTATAMRKNDLVRITSLAPGCRISIDGRHRATLNARKTYDFKLDSKKHEAVYISASSPVLVCVYFTSHTMGGEMGDPSMVYINPIEQQMDKVTFGTYNTVSSKYHFVNVVTLTKQVQNMTLDGNSIVEEFKKVPTKPELSYARINVQHGSHTLECQDGGFVAHVYGLGSYESYAYSVGSNSRVLNQFDEEGNLILSNIPDELEDLDSDPDSLGTRGKKAPTYANTDTLPAVEFDGITLNELKRKGTVKGVIKDKDGLIVDPKRFHISTDSDIDYLFDSIGIRMENDTVILTFHTRSRWCDCFVPKRVKVNVILTPIKEDDHANRIIIPITVPISKESPWLSRCLWVIIAVGGLLLLLYYLLLLLKKRRFKKNASITPIYYNQYGEEVDDGASQKLRKRGFAAWLARWFWPGAEKRTLSFFRPNISAMTFVATDSQEIVDIPNSSIDPSRMTINGYNPDSDKKATLRNNDKIDVNGNTGEPSGYLRFNPYSQKDGIGFQIFLSTLLVIDVIAILVLIFLTIRGLF